MQEINIDDWPRKSHFQFFAQADYPHYNICFDIDITDLLSFTRKSGAPFYFTTIHLAAKTANEIEAFRYRRRGEKVVLHETITPSFTYMNSDDDLFKMITVEYKSDLNDFIAQANARVLKQTDYFDASDFVSRDDFVYITSIPWISFTHVSHTFSLNKDDSVPRISWGKFYQSAERTMLPFSVQASHCFVDGIHIGQYKERFEKNIIEIGS